MKKDNNNTISQLSQRLARLNAHLDAHEHELDPEAIWDLCEECESLKSIIHDLQEEQYYEEDDNYDYWGDDGFD